MNTFPVIASAAKQSSSLLALDCRVTALLAMTVVTGACSQLPGQKPEVLACESFLKRSLASPASFRRQSVRIGTEKISKEDYVLADGWRPIEVFAESSRQEAIDPAIRTVVISYDAKNAYGTELRQTGMCQFAMADARANQFQSDDLMKDADERADMNDVFAIAPNMTEEERTRRDCCLHVYYEKYRRTDPASTAKAAGAS